MNTKLEKSFVSYLTIGVIVTLMDWLTFYALVNLFQVHYQYSITISFITGAVIKFGLNKSVTFKNKSKKYAKQVTAYSLMVFISWVLSLLLMQIFIEVLSFEQFTSRVITSILILFFGYFFDKNLTYKS